MAAIITPPITPPLETLRRDFPDYHFIQGDDFVWSSEQKRITYRPIASHSDIWTLLHEIAHAELRHTSYTRDIELIHREMQAWHYAVTTLAPTYAVSIPQDHIDDHMDSYRIWLHERSLCPTCGQNSFQTTQNTYSCSNCKCTWRVNEARICRLRRVRLQDRNQPVW